MRQSLIRSATGSGIADTGNGHATVLSNLHGVSHNVCFVRIFTGPLAGNNACLRPKNFLSCCRKARRERERGVREAQRKRPRAGRRAEDGAALRRGGFRREHRRQRRGRRGRFRAMRPVLRVLRRGGHAGPICQRCRMTLLQNICFRNLEFLTRRRRTERICDRLALWRRSPGDRAGLLCTVQLTRPSSQAIGKAGAAGPPRTSTARRSRRPSAASVPEIHI